MNHMIRLGPDWTSKGSLLVGMKGLRVAPLALKHAKLILTLATALVNAAYRDLIALQASLSKLVLWLCLLLPQAV